MKYQQPWKLVDEMGLKVECAGNMVICDFRDWEDQDAIHEIANLMVMAPELQQRIADLQKHIDDLEEAP